MRKSAKRVIAVATGIAVFTGAGAAWAAWVASGTGTATAKASTAQQLTTVDASASTTADLYPGATGAVTVRIANPNSYPVRITGITGNGAITAKSGTGIGACSVTGVSFVNQSALTVDVAAHGESTVSLPGAVTMNNTSEDGCQGATFLIPVSMSGGSNAS